MAGRRVLLPGAGTCVYAMQASRGGTGGRSPTCSFPPLRSARLARMEGGRTQAEAIDDAMVERAAREAFWADDIGGHIKGDHTWESIPEEGRDAYRTMIRAALGAALRQTEGQASAEIERFDALTAIRVASGARHDQVNWPVAIRAALEESQGGLRSPERHADVLRAIGVLCRLPFNEMLPEHEAARR